MGATRTHVHTPLYYIALKVEVPIHTITKIRNFRKGKKGKWKEGYER